MSRNENISQISPDTDYSLNDFSPVAVQLSVDPAGQMTKIDSNGDSTPLGPIQLAAAVYITAASIDANGCAVMHLSNDTKITLGKVTASRSVPVTINGSGQYVETDKTQLMFTPIKTKYPLILQNNKFEYLQTNSLKLSQHARLEHRGPIPAGRYFTNWSALPIEPIINNLGLAINNQLFTLPAGRYYIKLANNTFLGDYTYLAIIDSVTNLPIHDFKVAYTGRTSASGLVLGSQVLVVDQTVTVYFGHRVDVQVGTHEDGRGVSSPSTVSQLYDIYSVLEIWRLDE